MIKRRLVFATLFGLHLWMIFPTFGQIDWQPFPGDLKKELAEQIKFGYLPVPENHDNPDSRQIHVAFTIIKSKSDQPLPDPVVVLPGGPGGAFSPMVERIYNTESIQNVLAHRDIILIDPRGTGFSNPKLCDNINDSDLSKALTFATEEQRLELLAEAWSKCAELMAEAGADVRGYSAIQVAQDAEKLRQELGYESWNIRGHSYGSYFGFVLMQTYPESVRSAFLSGMVNRNLYYDFSQFDTWNVIYNTIEACKNDPDCSARFPDFENIMQKAFQHLESEPVAINYFNSEKDEITAYITPSILLNGLQALLYNKQGIEIIPLLMNAIAEGNMWIIENLAASLINDGRFSGDLRQDMLTIVRGNDLPLDPAFLAPPTNPNALQWLKNEWIPNDSERQQFTWDIIKTSDSIPQPQWKVLDIPVLLVSGGLDPVTPAYRGEDAMQYFSNASHHVVPGSGHYPHTDGKVDFAAFLDNPDPQVPFESISEITSLQFVTDISFNKGIASLMATIVNQNYGVLVVPALFILLSFFGFLYFPIVALVKKVRKSSWKLPF
ncbi:MAG: alpha/beta hydrolase [Bacteroidota bacterium]